MRNEKWKKVMLVTLLLSCIFSFNAFADWKQSDDGSWKFYNNDGSMATNAIIETDGNLYYINFDGVMVTDQWVLSDENYYYAGSDGAFLRSTLTPDGYLVDENGVWVVDDGSTKIFGDLIIKLPEDFEYTKVTDERIVIGSSKYTVAACFDKLIFNDISEEIFDSTITDTFGIYTSKTAVDISGKTWTRYYIPAGNSSTGDYYYHYHLAIGDYTYTVLFIVRGDNIINPVKVMEACINY